MKTQASFPSLHLGSLWETEFCQSSEPTLMHFLQLTDRLVIIEIATFPSHSDGQPCSGQIRPQSASDHWEQIWMNFNWKSWKMLSARHRVIYDITLIPGVSAKNGGNCSTEEKCKQWMRNIKCSFRFSLPLSKIMKRSGFWDVSHYGSEWMISSNMTKTLHFSNKGVLSFEDQYFYPFIEP